MKKNIKTAVCTISKNEDQYLLEWIEYYKSIGFDNIVFYDNNNEDNENQYKIIKPYIDNGFIKYHDFKNKHNCSQQHLAYVDCLRTYKDDFDWIAFFDVDEFLTLKEHTSIKHFLSSNNNFNNYWNIALRWVIMDDNDLIYNDKKPVLERFTRETDFQPNMKSIVNTKNVDIDFIDEYFNLHYMQMQNFNVICNIHGEICDRSISKREKSPVVYLKHFRFKTVEECVKKINNGDAFFSDINKRYECIDWFFKCNKITTEKILIIRQNFPEYDLTELIKKMKK